MAKTLGLDLGTNSIGWAIIESDKNKIINSGVRIFPEGIEPETQGKGDKEMSKNANRREARQSRRQNFRTRIRRIKLLESLIKLKMCPLSFDDLEQWKRYDKSKGKSSRQFPQTPKFVEWLKQNPYKLRAKALKENISLEELGRIFYHMIQRRGFLSNRKSQESGKIFDGKDKVIGIKKTKKQIQNSTLGNYLYSIYPEENKPYKTIKDENGKELRIRARYTLRRMYIEEFNKIWDRQAKQLKLNNNKVETKKVRFYKGTINSKRNKNQIKHLQEKFGKDKVIIDKKAHKITTLEKIPIKEFFGGEIWEENDELKHRSQQSLLFYQRPLRSQKGLLSKCSLESRKFYDKKNKKWITVGPTPCAKSHPDYELFRAYQFINNIRYGTKQKLDKKQREIVLNLINKNPNNFDFKKIIKVLKLTDEHFNYDNKFKVAGNYTISKIKKMFKPEIWEKSKNDIWHCFYFYNDNDKLITKLHDDFGLKEKDFNKIEKINLKDGYSNISLKAIRNILPFLEKGYKYNEAVILGGVRNAFKKTVDNKQVDRWKYFASEQKKIEDNIVQIIREKGNKEGEAIEKIKNYLSYPKNNLGFEKNDKSFRKLYHHSQEIEKKKTKDKLSEIENLRNPIVQQALNELRRLVNSLLEHYRKEDPDFSFDEIKVELARDLRSGKDARQRMSIRMSENNKKNEEARQKLTEYGLQHSRENIQKYLLFREIEDKNGTVVCPYTNKTININDLLGSENKFQIEHIIPRSISLNDSFTNKTLCDSKFNGLKGNQTPYQFYSNNKDANLWNAKTWEEVEQRAFKLLPYNKAKRFVSKNQDLELDSFIERQLNDTRYISKKAKEILTEICDSVSVTPGNLTSELRHLWGLNNVLQPIKNIKLENSQFDINKPKQHYLILDSDDNSVELLPEFNEKPKIGKNETTITGQIKDKKFTSKFLKDKVFDVDLEKGYYWTKIKLSDSPTKITKKYTDKPSVNENEIILRGRVEKSRFIHKSFPKGIPVKNDDDFYWTKFDITDVKFELPKKKEKPKKTGKQILLWGEVKNGIFKSYIYERKTEIDDGKYWAIIDVDINSISCLNVKNELPKLDENEIIISGSVNNDGVFSSDIDAEHLFKTKLSSGKYWAVFGIEVYPTDYFLIKNSEPKLKKDQKLVKGKVWVNKDTGEIKFDPMKNRDDHRHHAIDAIVVALTKQGYLQKLSTYNANRDNKRRGKQYDKPQFEKPWESFFNDVKDVASEIIISHKQNNPVLTKVNKTILKNGRKIKSRGYSARGQLHKESVFGKRKAPNSEEAYHIRKSLDSLTTHKHIEKIVDSRIKEIIKKYLQEKFNIDTSGDYKIPKNAFFYNGKPLVFLPNKNGEPVPIKKVRIKEFIGNAVKLKSENQFVNPRNNHHVIIYKDENGELNEHIVTLWESVERAAKKLPVYALPKPGIDKPKPVEIITSIERNDMFILGLSDDEFDIYKNDIKFMSRNLYRVQKISSMFYAFRHHLASTINNKNEEMDVQSFKRWDEVNPIKVKVNLLGWIERC